MIKLILCFSIIFNFCFAQDTINLSQTHFKINSCEIDSIGFVFLKTLKPNENNKNYVLIYKEYTSPNASAHYAACRSRILSAYLKSTYEINILEVKFETLTNRKKVKNKSKTKIPINKEIFLIPKQS